MRIVIMTGLLIIAAGAASEYRIDEIYGAGSGLAFITPFENALVTVPWGFGSVGLLRPGEDVRFVSCPWTWAETNCFSHPAASGNRAAYGAARPDGFYIVLVSHDSIIETFGPFLYAGRPSFDRTGRVWFTADGYLYREGTSTGIELEAFSISLDPSGSTAVWCDDMDRIRSINTETGLPGIISDEYRFYSPILASIGDSTFIISPTLEGMIVGVSLDGHCCELAHGTNPFWCSDTGRMLFCRTTDDGYNITSAEIWSLIPGEDAEQLTFTSYVHEMQPVSNGFDIYAIDSASGALVTVTQ